MRVARAYLMPRFAAGPRLRRLRLGQQLFLPTAELITHLFECRRTEFAARKAKPATFLA
jgi:hypothetical protein